MKCDYFNSEICKQLACDLVTEQAQLMKHEALANEIKAKIVEGKQKLIKKLILGKEIILDEKKLVVVDVNFYDNKDTMGVDVAMVMHPDNYKMPYALTRREQQFVDELRDLVPSCRDFFFDSLGKDTLHTAEELIDLKHGIKLHKYRYWEIDFSSASTPGFFEQSGLEVRKEDGYYMLEDLETIK